MSSKKQRRSKSKKPKNLKISMWRNPAYGYAVFLLLLTFLVFGNSIKNGFTYDDKPFISQNRIVRQGFSGIPELFRTDFWEGYTNVHQVNPSYRPVPLISLAIEYQFWGLNPRVHHFVNVLIYGLSCVLLFFLLHALFKDRFPYLALATAVLFCVHPIHTEVVANIKGRDDLLALFHGLLALYLVMKYAEHKNIRFLVGALLAFLLGLMSKEHMMLWVAVIPLTLYFFSQLSLKKIAVYSSVFWGVSLIYFGIRAMIIGTQVIKLADFIDNPILKSNSAAEMWATRIDVLGLFIKKLAVPYPLSSDYSYAVISPTTWGNPEVYLWLVLYGALLYAAIRGWKQKRLYAYAIFLFLLTIAPISNIFLDYVVAFAERAMYTPSVGFILFFSILCYSGYRVLERQKYFQNIKVLTTVGISSIVILVVVGAVMSYQRNPVWKDDYTLFSTDIKTMPSSVRLNINYAQELIDKNTRDDAVPMNAELKEAKACLDNTLVIVPELAKVHMLYGNLYRITGRITEAEQSYSASKRLDPNNPALYFNLGLTAQIREDLEKAKGYYLKSLELYPNYGAALTNLGVIYGRQNALDKCIELLEKAVMLEPDLVDTYANLEQAYLLKGDKLKAEYYKQRGIEILRAQN